MGSRPLMSCRHTFISLFVVNPGLEWRQSRNLRIGWRSALPRLIGGLDKEDSSPGGRGANSWGPRSKSWVPGGQCQRLTRCQRLSTRSQCLSGISCIGPGHGRMVHQYRHSRSSVEERFRKSWMQRPDSDPTWDDFSPQKRRSVRIPWALRELRGGTERGLDSAIPLWRAWSTRLTRR